MPSAYRNDSLFDSRLTSVAAIMTTKGFKRLRNSPVKTPLQFTWLEAPNSTFQSTSMLLFFNYINLDLYRRLFNRGYRSCEPIDPAIFRKVKIDGGKYQNTACKVCLNAQNQKIIRRTGLGLRLYSSCFLLPERE